MKLPRYECNRCGYKWVPRSEKVPMACANPKCRSPYWNKIRERKVKQVDKNSEDKKLPQSS